MKKQKSIIASERSYVIEKEKDIPISEYFGEDTFSHKTMKQFLPNSFFKKYLECLEHGRQLDPDTANAVAHAMKEWALSKGATHFAHWFQPMTGSTAEKHDAFIEFTAEGEVIERFSGKQLVQSEPDASSLPSGGIRTTFEARGYTTWDMSSPAFIRKKGISTTLCIPSAYISYTGEALDQKTPLLRSILAVNKSALRILKLLGNKTATKVIANLGPEQEYFLIDKDYFFKRQDLLLGGRAVMGAPPSKGQELEDQYFGSIKERISSYMHDVEEELYKLGIPAKTRHNEVAPSQFEIAPIFEEANIAVDHNQLVMETLISVSKKHNLAVLMQEKPFAGINGSGKHVNWSLSDDLGSNMLNPGDTPQDNLQFLVFLVAAINAVYKHADILRAVIASYGNDHRLGANEAPPAIISVFLGDQLTRILEDIENGTITEASDQAIIDLGISSLPTVSRDNTDRNRTSPFAFTGNKFEFRAVGSSHSISPAATALNTIAAESLNIIAEKIEKKGGDIKQATIDTLREIIKDCKPVLFNGDNYSQEWEKEAEKRGLPNNKTTPEALKALTTEKAAELFEKHMVLSRVELDSRYQVRLERYIKVLEIEFNELSNMTYSQVIPAAMKYQKNLAESIKGTIEITGDTPYTEEQKKLLTRISGLISSVYKDLGVLEDKNAKGESIENEQEKAEYLFKEIKLGMEELRTKIDELEGLVDDELWPMPKFWEILFIN